MTDQLKWAIARFTKNARAFADVQPEDVGGEPSALKVNATHIKMVNEVCDEMDELADRPGAPFLDFEALLNRSDSLPPAPVDFVSAVADAFLAAGRLS